MCRVAPVEAPTPAEEMAEAAQMAQGMQTVQTARAAQAAQMVRAAQMELPKRGVVSAIDRPGGDHDARRWRTRGKEAPIGCR